MTARSTSRSDGARASGGTPEVVSGVWLSDYLLVLLGRLPFPERGSGEAVIAGSVVPLEVRTLTDDRLPESLLPGGGALAVCRFEAHDAGAHATDPSPNGRPVAPEIRVGEAPVLIEPDHLERVITDVRTFLREHLAGLRRDTRARILDFLVEACGDDLERTGWSLLARRLLMVREALRERLPYCEIHFDEPHALHVDRLLSVDGRSFWAKGWLRDVDAEASQIVAVSPEGARAELLEGSYRHRRGDIERFYTQDKNEKHGFIKYFRLRVPSRLRTGWVVELRNEVGVAMESDCPAVITDPVAVREGILLDLAEEGTPGEKLLADHAYPALMRIQDQLRTQIEVEADTQYGTPPDSPEITIIVPLYERIDLVEHQLATFVRDPDIREAELIYVLDSPEVDGPFAGHSAELHKLYGIPFRVVTLKRNAGFSNATNVGASLARGRLLVLLNSDVMPERPGWLAQMASFYDATSSIGALAPKLIYEDGSLQHAGIYFHDVSLQWEGIHLYRETGSSLWENGHYFKGLHRDLPAANVARPVPAVTAACLMIERALYHELGGLRDIFVQGGYEDTDLCLRLIESGRENWYLPSVELYHLEDQSYPSSVRALTTKFNMWLHTHLWDEQIHRVMREQEAVWGHTAA